MILYDVYKISDIKTILGTVKGYNLECFELNNKKFIYIKSDGSKSLATKNHIVTANLDHIDEKIYESIELLRNNITNSKHSPDSGYHLVVSGANEHIENDIKHLNGILETDHHLDTLRITEDFYPARDDDFANNTKEFHAVNKLLRLIVFPHLGPHTLHWFKSDKVKTMPDGTTVTLRELLQQSGYGRFMTKSNMDCYLPAATNPAPAPGPASAPTPAPTEKDTSGFVKSSGAPTPGTVEVTVKNQTKYRFNHLVTGDSICAQQGKICHSAYDNFTKEDVPCNEFRANSCILQYGPLHSKCAPPDIKTEIVKNVKGSNALQWALRLKNSTAVSAIQTNEDGETIAIALNQDLDGIETQITYSTAHPPVDSSKATDNDDALLIIRNGINKTASCLDIQNKYGHDTWVDARNNEKGGSLITAGDKSNNKMCIFAKNIATIQSHIQTYIMKNTSSLTAKCMTSEQFIPVDGNNKESCAQICAAQGHECGYATVNYDIGEGPGHSESSLEQYDTTGKYPEHISSSTFYRPVSSNGAKDTSEPVIGSCSAKPPLKYTDLWGEPNNNGMSQECQAAIGYTEAAWCNLGILHNAFSWAGAPKDPETLKAIVPQVMHNKRHDSHCRLCAATVNYMERMAYPSYNFEKKELKGSSEVVGGCHGEYEIRKINPNYTWADAGVMATDLIGVPDPKGDPTFHENVCNMKNMKGDQDESNKYIGSGMNPNIKWGKSGKYSASGAGGKMHQQSNLDEIWKPDGTEGNQLWNLSGVEHHPVKENPSLIPEDERSDYKGGWFEQSSFFAPPSKKDWVANRPLGQLGDKASSLYDFKKSGACMCISKDTIKKRPKVGLNNNSIVQNKTPKLGGNNGTVTAHEWCHRSGKGVAISAYSEKLKQYISPDFKSPVGGQGEQVTVRCGDANTRIRADGNNNSMTTDMFCAVYKGYKAVAAYDKKGKKWIPTNSIAPGGLGEVTGYCDLSRKVTAVKLSETTVDDMRNAARFNTGADVCSAINQVCVAGYSKSSGHTTDFCHKMLKNELYMNLQTENVTIYCEKQENNRFHHIANSTKKSTGTVQKVYGTLGDVLAMRWSGIKEISVKMPIREHFKGTDPNVPSGVTNIPDAKPIHYWWPDKSGGFRGCRNNPANQEGAAPQANGGFPTFEKGKGKNAAGDDIDLAGGKVLFRGNQIDCKDFGYTIPGGKDAGKRSPGFGKTFMNSCLNCNGGWSQDAPLFDKRPGATIKYDEATGLNKVFGGADVDNIEINCEDQSYGSWGWYYAKTCGQAFQGHPGMGILDGSTFPGAYGRGENFAGIGPVNVAGITGDTCVNAPGCYKCEDHPDGKCPTHKANGGCMRTESWRKQGYPFLKRCPVTCGICDKGKGFLDVGRYGKEGEATGNAATDSDNHDPVKIDCDDTGPGGWGTRCKKACTECQAMNANTMIDCNNQTFAMSEGGLDYGHSGWGHTMRHICGHSSKDDRNKVDKNGVATRIINIKDLWKHYPIHSIDTKSIDVCECPSTKKLGNAGDDPELLANMSAPQKKNTLKSDARKTHLKHVNNLSCNALDQEKVTSINNWHRWGVNKGEVNADDSALNYSKMKEALNTYGGGKQVLRARGTACHGHLLDKLTHTMGENNECSLAHDTIPLTNFTNDNGHTKSVAVAYNDQNTTASSIHNCRSCWSFDSAPFIVKSVGNKDQVIFLAKNCNGKVYGMIPNIEQSGVFDKHEETLSRMHHIQDYTERPEVGGFDHQWIPSALWEAGGEGVEDGLLSEDHWCPRGKWYKVAPPQKQNNMKMECFMGKGHDTYPKVDCPTWINVAKKVTLPQIFDGPNESSTVYVNVCNMEGSAPNPISGGDYGIPKTHSSLTTYLAYKNERTTEMRWWAQNSIRVDNCVHPGGDMCIPEKPGSFTTGKVATQWRINPETGAREVTKEQEWSVPHRYNQNIYDYKVIPPSNSSSVSLAQTGQRSIIKSMKKTNDFDYVNMDYANPLKQFNASELLRINDLFPPLITSHNHKNTFGDRFFYHTQSFWMDVKKALSNANDKASIIKLSGVFGYYYVAPIMGRLYLKFLSSYALLSLPRKDEVENFQKLNTGMPAIDMDEYYKFLHINALAELESSSKGGLFKLINTEWQYFLESDRVSSLLDLSSKFITSSTLESLITLVDNYKLNAVALPNIDYHMPGPLRNHLASYYIGLSDADKKLVADLQKTPFFISSIRFHERVLNFSNVTDLKYNIELALINKIMAWRGYSADLAVFDPILYTGNPAGDTAAGNFDWLKINKGHDDLIYNDNKYINHSGPNIFADALHSKITNDTMNGETMLSIVMWYYNTVARLGQELVLTTTGTPTS